MREYEQKKEPPDRRPSRQVSVPSSPMPGTSPQAILTLQQTVGNAAVARALRIQRAPGDFSRKRAATTSGTPAGKRSRIPADLTEQEREIAHRDRPLRMLDRAGRVLHDSMTAGVVQIQGREPTPHFAVILRGDQLHVAGNTKNPFTNDHKEAAINRLKNVVEGTEPDNPTSKPEVLSDMGKIRDVVDGKYADDPNAEWFEKFKQALTKPVVWDDSMVKEGRGDENVHGEMTLLGTIIDDQFRKERNTATLALDPVYLGGRLQPCQMCAWVIQAVNEEIGAHRGFWVVATPGSGQPFENWHVPQWLMPTITTDQAHKQAMTKAARIRYAWDRFQRLAGRLAVREGNRAATWDKRTRGYYQETKRTKQAEHRGKNRTRSYLEPVESESEPET
jgi:hypothetical protein